MATIIKQDEEKEFERHPQGLSQAICLFVEDIGLQKTAGYQGKPDKIKRKVVIAWESEEKQADGNPFIITKKYTASFFKEARLLKDLEAWRGRKFTEAELAGFDLDAVIGKNCLLNIVHNEKEGKTYANIQGLVPLKAGMVKMTPSIRSKPEWFVKWIKTLQDNQVTVGEAQSQPIQHVQQEEDLPF